MAQVLELDASNNRAMFGLLMVSNAFLNAAANTTKKQAIDEHSVDVAKELVKYGADKLLNNTRAQKCTVQCRQLWRNIQRRRT